MIQTGATTATALGLAAVGTRQLVAAQDASPSPSPAGSTAAGTTSCVALTAELTEGPYYVDEALVGATSSTTARGCRWP